MNPASGSSRKWDWMHQNTRDIASAPMILQPNEVLIVPDTQIDSVRDQPW